jgi:ABC-type Na+ transport system ATPase subunit NatA
LDEFDNWLPQACVSLSFPHTSPDVPKLADRVLVVRQARVVEEFSSTVATE